MVDVYKCHDGTAIPEECPFPKYPNCDACKYENNLWYLRYQKAQLDLTNNQGHLWGLKRKMKSEERLTELRRRIKKMDPHKRKDMIIIHKYYREIEGLEKEVQKL